MSVADGRSVLVVDDEAGMRTALRASFLRHGWDVKAAGSVQEAAGAVDHGNFDLVVTDVRMRDGDGFEVMRHVRRLSPSTAVVLLTAFGTVPEAVRSMRGGAFDYLTKPVSFDDLHRTARRVMQQVAEASPATPHAGVTMVGRHPAMLYTLQRARAAAATNANVLIEAEPGTGKTLLASYLHEHSDHATEQLVKIDAATAMPEDFPLCGALLLEDVERMPLPQQARLLRALERNESRTRYISTTRVPLAPLVAQGRFRSDLHDRLSVLPLTLPPLRERLDDLPLLAAALVERLAEEMGLRAPALDPALLDQWQQRSWPGNVVELRDAVRCWMRPRQEDASAPAAGQRIADVERAHLEKTLALANGNRTRAAAMLGISLRTMRNRIRAYGLPPRTFAPRRSA